MELIWIWENKMARSKLAVWSFWFSLIAFFCFFILYFIIPPSIMPMEGALSIILTILGWLPLLVSIVTFILGIVALRKIKKRKQKGKGLAIATIILSAMVILFFIYVFYLVMQFARLSAELDLIISLL